MDRGLARSPLGGRDDGALRIGLEHVRQPLARGGREYFFRILEHARRAYEPSGREVELDVEVSQVVVELRRAEVGIEIPAALAEVVEDGNARIPLPTW